MTVRATLIVIAKAPRAGFVKTRLCPPCTPEQAASLARAALVDTLCTVATIPARRRVLALDGSPGSWLPTGFDVVPQRTGSLDRRLADAFAHADGPAVLVGMDTPQISTLLMEHACNALLEPGVDAVLGDAYDGGWWCIGLRHPDPRAFLGIEMSTADTGRVQRERLTMLGLVTRDLPILRDVDHFEDALAVAERAPGSRFASAVAALAIAAPAP